MASSINLKRLSVPVVILLLVAGAVAYSTGILTGSAPQPPQNSILVIAPYQYNGAWVFDDDRFGLVREPFVAGVPEMIDLLVDDIPDAAEGFRLTFSANPFPGFEKKLTRTSGDRQGNFYSLDDPPMEGWICPALFKYYDKAPAELYVKADPVR